MNCSIPGHNIKPFTKAIQALSKIGDELYFQIKPDCLILKSLNMNKTSYGIFNFSELFFSTYQMHKDNDDDELTCTIPMKAALSVFKSTNLKNTAVDSCRIELHPKETKLHIKLHYQQGVIVTRNLHLIDTDVVNIVYRKDATLNQISSNSQLFAQILVNFQLSDDDISIDFTSNKATIRNYTTNNVNVHVVRSQMVLNSIEFANYQVQDETNITFSLKPLRAAVQFAEIFNLNVVLKFEKCGRPVVLIVKNPTFEGVFVVATLNADGDTQTTATSTTRTSATCARTTPQLNLTVEDRQAIEAMFTEEEDCVMEQMAGGGGSGKGGERDDGDDDVIETTQCKRVKTVFGRCFEQTYCMNSMDLGEVLAPNSDSETE